MVTFRRDIYILVNILLDKLPMYQKYTTLLITPYPNWERLIKLLLIYKYDKL